MAVEETKRTPLYELHVELAAKIVPFAGYAMPVQYPAGILAEHNHTRRSAGLFDVSHMGQVTIRGDDPITALEALVPADIHALPVGGMRYTMFTNEHGGILDDLIVTRLDGTVAIIVNAACKDADLAHLRARLGPNYDVVLAENRALLALQGPHAGRSLDSLVPGVTDLSF
ncbi:MAG: glycine cleavage system aminomethyltransferase GcvT, partial [Proteobacteria bacterium]|nr:glycine cleavage system aminomethyltransferase GcvT [Pseudomonadota bacterium]